MSLFYREGIVLPCPIKVTVYFFRLSLVVYYNCFAGVSLSYELYWCPIPTLNDDLHMWWMKGTEHTIYTNNCNTRGVLLSPYWNLLSMFHMINPQMPLFCYRNIAMTNVIWLYFSPRFFSLTVHVVDFLSIYNSHNDSCNCGNVKFLEVSQRPIQAQLLSFHIWSGISRNVNHPSHIIY